MAKCAIVTCRCVFLLTYISLMAGCRSLAATPAITADPIDELVRAEMTEQHIPGLSLTIIKDGHPVKTAGYGLANVEWNAPAGPETVYQIQSVTKTFTATAVMMLVEEGKIDLDAPIDRYLEGVPESWKNITIRLLLSHTSGIKDFINEPTANLRLDVSEEDVLKAAATRPLNFQPGEQYAYSNTNYHLLAMLIRKLTGKYYGDFLRERIFEPLGMSDTRIISLTEIIPHRAAGYIRENNALRNGEFIAPSILSYGGGGIRSTVLDMAKWDTALYTEKLLKKSSLEQMWAPARFNNGQASGYGFGWGIHVVNDHRCLGHTGAHSTGFTTVIQRYPEDGLTVVIFSNLFESDVNRIARRVAEHYLPALAPSPR